MASKYSQLPSYGDDIDSSHLQSPQKEKRPWGHWALLLAFISGTLFGVGISLASIATFISRADISLDATKSVAVKATSGHDFNEYYGIVAEPIERDPVCGNDRHQAKRNGCKFDVMASRWYPEECFYGDVLEQMLKECDFDWFWDDEHTKPASRETALTGDHDQLYPLYNYHIFHCLYQFRRLHMAIIDHRQIDDDAYSYGHTLHCTRLIMQWPNEWKFGKNSTTVAPSGMAYCIPPFI